MIVTYPKRLLYMNQGQNALVRSLDPRSLARLPRARSLPPSDNNENLLNSTPINALAMLIVAIDGAIDAHFIP